MNWPMTQWSWFWALPNEVGSHGFPMSNPNGQIEDFTKFQWYHMSTTWVPRFFGAAIWSPLKQAQGLGVLHAGEFPSSWGRSEGARWTWWTSCTKGRSPQPRLSATLHSRQKDSKSRVLLWHALTHVWSCMIWIDMGHCWAKFQGIIYLLNTCERNDVTSKPMVLVHHSRSLLSTPTHETNEILGISFQS